MKFMLLLTAAMACVVIGVEGQLDKDFKRMENTFKEVREEVLRSARVLLEANENANGTGDGCQCVDYNCGCCGRIVIKKLEIEENICVNTSYLPQEYGIRVTITFNDFVLLNQSISAKNPPPLCVGVPHVKELSLCIRFYKLSISNFTFSGCVDVEVHILHIIEEKYDLGCWKTGNATLANAVQKRVKLNQVMQGHDWKINDALHDHKLRSVMKFRKTHT